MLWLLFASDLWRVIELLPEQGDRWGRDCVSLLLKISGELIAADVSEEVYEWCCLCFVLKRAK